MRNLLRNVKISTKIFILTGLVLLMMSLVIGFGLRQINKVGEELKAIVKEDIVLLEALNKIAFHNSEQEFHLERAIQFGKHMAQDDAVKGKFEVERKNFLKHGQTIAQEIKKNREFVERMYEKYKITRRRKKRVLQMDYELRNVDKEHADYQFFAERVFNLLSQGKLKEAEPTIQKIAREIEEEEEEHFVLDKPIESFALAIEGFIQDSMVRAEESKRAAWVGMLLISLFILLFNLGLGIFVSYSITGPLHLAVKIANRVANGERKLKIQIPSKDETGTLLASLEHMAEALGEADAKIREEMAERKKVEERLRYAAQEWRTTFDSIADMVSIQDKDYKIVRVNKSFADAFKMKPQEVIGKTCYKLIHGTNEPRSDCPHKQALEIKKPTRGEYFEPHLGIYLEVSASPIFNEKSEVIGSLHIAVDITKRKKAEEKIKKSENLLKEQAKKLDRSLKEALKSREILTSMLDDNNQIREKLEKRLAELKQTQNMLIQSEKLASLGELVSDMAHEVNNPLMVIHGRAELSLMEDLKNKEVKESLNTIMDQCQRAKDIIQRLLVFSKPSKGELKEVNINESLEFVIKLIEHQYSLSDIKIIKNYASLPEVKIDEKQMQEVFMNLLKNSAEAMPKGGNITISTSKENRNIRIDFKDTGCGISKEDSAKLFDPFFTTKESGTGLGLSVCYGIIKVHGGELKYESKPGKGTMATIILPIEGGGT